MKRVRRSKLSVDYLESIAAVTAVFMQDDRYRDFYEEHGEALGGFPGLWTFCGVAGDAFARMERGTEWDGQYIEAIDLFVDMLYKYGPHTSVQELERTASTAISMAMTKDAE